MPGFYNPTPSSEECLAHFGILGQKWGKKNGPPYPLQPGDHSAAEKKAGYQKSLTGDSAKNEDKKAKKYEKQYNKIRNTAKTDEEKDKKLRALDEKTLKEHNKSMKKAQKEYKKLNDEAEKEAWKKSKTWGDAYAELYSQYAEKERKLEFDKKYKTFDPDEEESKDNVYDPEGDKIKEEKLEAAKEKLWSDFYDKVDEKADEYYKEAFTNTHAYSEMAKMHDKYGAKNLGDIAIRNEEKYDGRRKEYTNKLHSSSSYTKGFLDFVKSDIGKPEQVDDYELMELLIYEYEDYSGKKATKGNWHDD